MKFKREPAGMCHEVTSAAGSSNIIRGWCVGGGVFYRTDQSGESGQVEHKVRE